MVDSARQPVIQQAEADRIVFQGIQQAAGALGAASLVFLGGNVMAAHESHVAGSPRDAGTEVQAGRTTEAAGQEAIELARDRAGDIRTWGLAGSASITAAGLGFAAFNTYRKLKKASRAASETPNAPEA